MPSQARQNGSMPRTTRIPLLRQFRPFNIALLGTSVIGVVVIAFMIITTWAQSSLGTRVVYLDVLAALILLVISNYGVLMLEWQVRRRLAQLVAQHVTHATVTAAQQQLTKAQARTQTHMMWWLRAFTIALVAPIVVISRAAPAWTLWVCFGMVIVTCIGYAVQQIRLQHDHAETLALIAYEPRGEA